MYMDDLPEPLQHLLEQAIEQQERAEMQGADLKNALVRMMIEELSRDQLAYLNRVFDVIAGDGHSPEVSMAKASYFEGLTLGIGLMRQRAEDGDPLDQQLKDLTVKDDQ